MDEIWEIIEEFPRYSVSNFGRVMNNHTERILALSTTIQGAVKVTFREREGLSRENIVYYTRSVKVLVAIAFVEGRTFGLHAFNTPINLDGDQLNNRSDNLAWRPRWFAWRYSRQFHELPYYHDTGPLVEIESGDYYKDIYHAGTKNGLLFYDIWESITRRYRLPIFPTHQLFALAK